MTSTERVRDWRRNNPEKYAANQARAVAKRREARRADPQLVKKATDDQRERYRNNPQHRECRLADARQWKRNNRELHAKILARNPMRLKAKGAVAQKIHNGNWPSARDLLCSICGAQADHYHHHLGYEQDHWYDVVPVCVQCHADLHPARR